MAKTKELKQEYIVVSENYTPITDYDKISLEKSNRLARILFFIAIIFFILTLPFLCIFPYEYISGNIIWPGHFINKIVIFVALIAFEPIIILFIFTCIERRKKNDEILNSKKIYSIKGVVESYRVNRVSSSIYLTNGGSYTQGWGGVFGRGMYVEIRYNPYTIKRLDDELYDVNFIYKCGYIEEIEKYEIELLELKEKLNNTNPRKKKRIEELKNNIERTENSIRYYNGLVSKAQSQSPVSYYTVPFKQEPITNSTGFNIALIAICLGIPIIYLLYVLCK
ncbi:MAG: hypothetical protein FWG92_00565 [Leptospirales bacterium]|nr:hypothetical protein [Leptospirales bacterium]